MFCTSCGDQNPDDGGFCASCGAAISTAAGSHAHDEIGGSETPAKSNGATVPSPWLVVGGMVSVALIVVASVWLLTRPDEPPALTSSVNSNSRQEASSPASARSDSEHEGISPDTKQPALSFRPVLDLVQQSPALTEPKGVHPTNVDPITGLSEPDDVNAAIAYLPSEDGLFVYIVGPAFVTGSDMKGGRAQFSGTGGWVVVPEFTDQGGKMFRVATGELATYPVGSPQRRLAIVVDGVVVSAPEIAAGVSPDEGLDPNQVVITIGVSGDPQAEAEALAAALRN